MSGYKTFAVAGAGGLGKLIVEELLTKQKEGIISSAVVLSRSSNGQAELQAKGAKIIAVDYASPASVQSALSGIDVLISTIAQDYVIQDKLAAGAKEAGVKLFVPSEFGAQTDGATESIWGQKDALKKKLKNEIKLPYAAYYTGFFPDWAFKRGHTEELGFDFANGKLTIPGSGDELISWTSQPDIARYVAYTLTALPKDKLEWRIFRIEAERTGFKAIAEAWKARSGKEVTISYRPLSELEDAIVKNPNDFYSTLLLVSAKGFVIVGGSDALTNDEFPDWKPKKVVDYLLETYGQ